jgi:histidyl-tRNA synthetase
MGGLRVEVYPEALRNGKDLGKAFKYADTRKARFVTVLGQDEISRGEVKIKNLTTGEQQAIARASVATTLAHRTSDLGPRTSDDAQ